MNKSIKILKEENTRDLKDFGARERAELILLLTLWNDHGLPDGFDDNGVTFEFNPNSGYVFLVNDEYQTVMESGGKLYVFHSTPYDGLEGSIEEIMAENDPDTMQQDDVDYVVEWVKNYGAEEIPENWKALIDGAGDDGQIEDSIQPRLREARKVTDAVVGAFLAGQKKSQGNSMTDGLGLYLHGNKIAEMRNGSLWITNAGWASNTTKERLNGLPGVGIYQKAGRWFLNGVEWDGDWIEIGPIRGNDQVSESLKRGGKSTPIDIGLPVNIPNPTSSSQLRSASEMASMLTENWKRLQNVGHRLTEAPDDIEPVVPYKPRKAGGRYVNILVLPNKDLKLTLTHAGQTEVKSRVESDEDDNPNYCGLESMDFAELVEDITTNSEYVYTPDIGSEGFGLTTAPGFIMGNMGNDGDWESDVLIWYYEPYQIRCFIEDMMNSDGAVFTYVNDSGSTKQESSVVGSVGMPKKFSESTIKENYSRIFGDRR